MGGLKMEDAGREGFSGSLRERSKNGFSRALDRMKPQMDKEKGIKLKIA